MASVFRHISYMQHNSLFVFDIETVPDTEAVRNLTGFESDNTAELREELNRYHLEITDGRNAFPRQPFHKIVAISFLEAEISRMGKEESFTFKRLESNKTEKEEEIIAGFFDYLGKRQPRLVSYNGRGFDLPVLKFRAMKYGVSAPFLFQLGDKWNSYMSRYSADWHCDLLDVLKDYGGVGGGLKLNEICAVLGFPGKFGVDGSKVSEMWDGGALDAIRHYCETDVLNTYLVYLRLHHFMGKCSTQNYNAELENILKFIEESKEEKGYLKDFHTAWEDANNGEFLLG